MNRSPLLSVAPNLLSFFLGLCAALSPPVSADVVLRIMLEEPVAGEIHGGVGNLRGWAVATDGIDKIEIMIDGVYAFDAPYGGARGDVGSAFPEVANASESGFSLAYAYSNLSPGSHTISAVAHTLEGDTQTSSATFETVRFKQSFISGADAVDLAATSCTVAGDEISASNALIGGDRYDMVLDWRTAEQGFEIIKVVEDVNAVSVDNDSDSDTANDNAATWQPPANVEWIEYNFNVTDTFCDDPEGFCAGWLENASQECKDNYQLGDSAQNTQTRLQYESCVDEMVFKPYISSVADRTTTPLTDAQRSNAATLQSAGWDQPVSQAVQFRVAADIPTPIVEASKEGMLAAIDLLGNYGPLRVYLVGNDLDLADELANDFCDYNYRPDEKSRCLADQGESIREMAYIYPGGNGFQQSSWNLAPPVQSFVHNPYADENNQHSVAEGELVNDKIVNAHEYFHVYQGAHNIHRGADDLSFGWSTTRWVEEGAAVYFEQFISARLGWQTEQVVKNRVVDDLKAMKSFAARFPDISIRDVDTSAQTSRLLSYCGELCIGALQYEFGHIAFRYLEAKTSQDAVLFNYWDEYTHLGWAEAFNKVFGQSVAEFYTEFETFLLLSVEEQLPILGIDDYEP